MSIELGHHLAKRAVHHCMGKAFIAPPSAPSQEQVVSSADGDYAAFDDVFERVNNPVAVASLLGTAALFWIAAAIFEYAIRYVAVNLVIVENVGAGASSKPAVPTKKPSSGEFADEKQGATALLDDYDNHDDTVAASDQSGDKPQHVTANLKSIFRHLRAIDGIRAPLRGAGHALCYAIAYTMISIFTSVLTGITGAPFGFVLVKLASAVLCCNMHATWTHSIIATPGDKPFFQRCLPRGVATGLIMPTLRAQFAQICTVNFVVTFAVAANDFASEDQEMWLIGLSLGLAVLFGVVGCLFLILPAHISLIRTEASLLPEDREAVVPFDRTFGGRFDWEKATTFRERYLAHLTMRGAYSTFDKYTYYRVLGMAWTYVTVMLRLSIAFMLLVVAQVYVFGNMGDKVF